MICMIQILNNNLTLINHNKYLSLIKDPRMHRIAAAISHKLRQTLP